MELADKTNPKALAGFRKPARAGLTRRYAMHQPVPFKALSLLLTIALCAAAGPSSYRPLQQASASPQRATTNQASQFGITWTFDGDYETGQFANGDTWVVG